MDGFVPWQVYENLCRMITRRGATITTAPLTPDALAQKLNHFEYTTISGDRPASDPRKAAIVIVVLIAPKSKHANKSGDFKKLLRGLPKVGKVPLEVVFISDLPITIHIKKQIAIFRASNPMVFIESYSYNIFMINAPEHASVPPHHIALDAEVDEFCSVYYTSKDRFPKILQSDPQAVWLGLQPGMVVRIERISETAGTAPIYRVCIRG